MNLFTRHGLFILGLIFSSAGFNCALAADTNPPPRLTVELRDGSRIVGTSAEKNFKFHSELLGNLKLAVKDIRSIECVSSNAARLITINGDTLTVRAVDSEFGVNTSFGVVELAVNSVRKLSVTPGFTGGTQQVPGLVALWSGEGNGDDSVGGNSATLTDISFADGKVGQAFSFNGVSSSMKIPASPALDVGAGDGFTIMAWIKPSDVSGMHPLFQWLLNDEISDVTCLDVWIGIRPYENGVLMAGITGAPGNRFLVSDPETLAAGVFQHVALTYDKASGVGTWYLNGIIVARRVLGGSVINTKGNLWISHCDERPGNWSSGRTYAGLMDEIALYNRALSASEIQAICTEQNHGEPLALPAASNGWYEGWMR
jgi:Concanavalin A-like lectin/glucanases superfamily